MANSVLATKEQLTFIDQTVYEPKSAPLVARSLFSTLTVPDTFQAYRYKVKTGKALARAFSNRSTDIPVVDESLKETQVPITQFALGAEYSYLELKTAQQVGVNLLADQAQLVARGMGEYEDRLIFNGQDNSDPSMEIIGLTNTKTDKTGFQQVTATNTLSGMSGEQLRAFFKDAVGRITHLTGYAGVKPTLLLPQARIDELDNPYNEYNADMTPLDMISKWVESVQPVEELEGQYWHKENASKADKAKDMGILMVRTPDVAQIPVAMEMTRLDQETHGLVTKIPYIERIGGLAVRYPSAVVQLLGIN